MIRRVWFVICLAACGSAPRQPAKPLPHAPDAPCPDDTGCELAIEEAPRFEAPDGERKQPEPTDTVPQVVAAKPPEATCAAVGSSLASVELGNYAEEDQRAPVIAKHEARCVKLKLSTDERKCVFEARDKVTIAYCVPRFVPDLPIQIVDATECPKIMDGIRGRMATLNAPKQALWDRKLTALDRSCRQDRWTFTFSECARTNAMAAQPTDCLDLAPMPLQKLLQDRLAKATPSPAR